MSFLNKQSGHTITTGQERYPTLVWYNGKAELKQVGCLGYHGGLGLKASQPNCDSFPVGELIQYTYSNGQTEDVWAIVNGQVALMATRLDWYTEVKDGDRKRKVWHPHYQRDMGMKGLNHYLVILRGAESWHQENGLLRLTFSGVVNGIKFSKAEAGNVLYDFGQYIHKPAEKTYEASLDSYTFYIPMAPDKHQKASPNFASKITPPILAMPQYSSLEDCLADLYIGDAMMDFCAAHWDEAQAWGNDEYLLAEEQDNGYGETQESAPQGKQKTAAELIDAELDAIEYKHHGQDGPPMPQKGWTPPDKVGREEPPPRDYKAIPPPPDFDDIPF